MTTKITDNFSLDEFTNNDKSIIVNDVMMFMIKSLCENVLEPLRNFWGCKVKINSGIRTEKQNSILIKNGYNPSDKSDHFYGASVKTKTEKTRRRYGDTYNFSVGAVDIMPVCGGFALAAFDKTRQLFQPQYNMINLPGGAIKIGQFILEKGNSYWIHVSNHPSIIYSNKFVSSFLEKKPFLISLDNGKTYKEA